MERYKDIETGEVITREELHAEYTELLFAAGTEAETFEDYLQNCLEGTLERM